MNLLISLCGTFNTLLILSQIWPAFPTIVKTCSSNLSIYVLYNFQSWKYYDQGKLPWKQVIITLEISYHHHHLHFVYRTSTAMVIVSAKFTGLVWFTCLKPIQQYKSLGMWLKWEKRAHECNKNENIVIFQ